jgi:hypothetical protein
MFDRNLAPDSRRCDCIFTLLELIEKIPLKWSPWSGVLSAQC